MLMSQFLINIYLRRGEIYKNKQKKTNNLETNYSAWFPKDTILSQEPKP